MKINNSIHFTYWQFPLLLGLLLVFMNYSGISFLTELVSPDVNREFGLLENLQLLLIASSLIYVLKAIRLKDFWFEKLAYVVLAMFFLFLFLLIISTISSGLKTSIANIIGALSLVWKTRASSGWI